MRDSEGLTAPERAKALGLPDLEWQWPAESTAAVVVTVDGIMISVEHKIARDIVIETWMQGAQRLDGQICLYALNLRAIVLRSEVAEVFDRMLRIIRRIRTATTEEP